MKRVGNAFKGILGGFVFILIGIVLLWWNEGNNVRNIKTTAEMDKIVVDVPSDKVDSANEGKLVATHGKVINEEEMFDETFNVKVQTPIMKRVVEVYQWDEDSDTDEDGHTTYSYKKVWDTDIIDSGNFHDKNKVNPKTKPYEDQVYTSKDVSVGAFSLTDEQISTLSTKADYTNFDLETANKLNLTASSKYLTTSKNLDSPSIGDVRISFAYNDSSELSVLAVQSGNSFVDFVSSAGKNVNRVMDGSHSGHDMINVIKKENNFIKWLLRFLGTILIIGGIGAILKPISAITSYVPLLGSLVGAAVGLVSMLLGLALSFVVIAIAWVRWRPVLGISLLVGAAVLIVFLIMRGKKSKKPTDTPVQQEQPVQEENTQQ
ncbi:MAG: TMEM43 family protein [Bacilli bacterium]|nr:TMEM43 family protein [Bacilli bacterium]